MNISLAEVAELPLPVALCDADGVVASTPEWAGAGPGAVSYPLRRGRLVVGTSDVHPVSAALLDRLFAELDAVAASAAPVQAMRTRMLAASLRVLAGRDPGPPGTSADVVAHACAGIAARTQLRVAVESCDGTAVCAPPVAALVLVQLAANAERHDGAQAVWLDAADGVFSISWQAPPAARGADTARRRAERTRWGLGFARLAADAIGAAVYPPHDEPPQTRTSILETGLLRLALPLALVRGGSVVKATRTWDEETGALPGSRVGPDTAAGRCLAAAEARAGEVACVDGWTARRVPAGATWVAIPPDSVADRARDVLDGVAHERALWDGVAEPMRSRLVALAGLLGAVLGGELERVPGATWNRRAAEVAAAYGLRMAVPAFAGAGAVDPRVALFLAAEYGESLEVEGEHLHLRIAPAHRDDPVVRLFLAPGDDSLLLS